ncbi:MAG: type II toxin-antitoxin system HicB family antitoxin [bacterium]
MAKEYAVIITQDEEGYYIADVPELKGCHTQAKSIDNLKERIKEVIELCLEEESDEYQAVHFIDVQKIAV